MPLSSTPESRMVPGRVVLLSALCVSVMGLPTPSSKRNILFLMCDSMDGRVLDPTSDVSKRVRMPNLRRLAESGTNFVRTYAESPQCVPSRASMFTGRRTHEIQAWSNEIGVALGIPCTLPLPLLTLGLDAVPSSQEPDPVCLGYYGDRLCREWGAKANVTATLLDSMRGLGYQMNLYGKVDVGAGILNDPQEGNSTCNGFHSGPSLSICTRSADIRRFYVHAHSKSLIHCHRPTKDLPLKITNDQDNHVQEMLRLTGSAVLFRYIPRIGKW